MAAVDVRSQASKHRHQTKRDRVILPAHLIPEARLPTATLPSSRRQYEAACAVLAMQQRQQRQRKRSRRRSWKPYQVKILTQASSGFRFVRRRGIQQPVTTAMMMKNRARTNQRRVDAHYALLAQLGYMKSEGLFLSALGVENDTWDYSK